MGNLNPRRIYVFFSLLLLHREIFAQTENELENNSTINYRLPRVTIPKSYDIKFVPELIDGNFTFYGESTITVRVIEETSTITLHSKDLRIDENFTSLSNSEGVVEKPFKHSHVTANNFLAIEFDSPIIPGENYTLGLKWFGNMSSVPEGIYNSSYVDKNGKRVWLVATKFTQIHARRAFPCWDEPDIKATFKLSIKHHSNYTAESNTMASEVIFDPDGRQWTSFRETPPMSTDILAFVVSDFDCLAYKEGAFNVCGRKEILPNLVYSGYVTYWALSLLEDYFDSKYALPKLSQFAVPDATTGATENWGLIIHRESSLSYDEFVDPVSTKEYVTLGIIHELAHQWIGNNATPVSWKYSWIKEGLPTYIQYRIVDMKFFDWRAMDMFVTRTIQEAAFNFDSTDYYKHLEWDSTDPADIRSKFSPQIYNKGAAIFYMMSNILGEKVFESGIVKFVKQHAYGTFTSDDLWDAMQSVYTEGKEESAQNGLSIRTVMKPWVEQQGYPVINVTRDYDSGQIMIKQEGNLAGQKSNRWWIPINFATKSNPDFETTTPSHWLKPQDDGLIIVGVRTDDWIIVNIQQSGYYRVNYDETNWNLIADYMNSENYEKINVRNRAQLINDLSYMASSNRQNYTTFLNLARYLVREDDYPPWLPTFHAIRRLRRVIRNDEVDEALKKFVLRVMEKVIGKIGFECTSKNDRYRRQEYEDLYNATTKMIPIKKATSFYSSKDFLPRRLRAKFLSFACSLGHESCLESAKRQLRANFENATENPISADVVSWVYCYGALGSEDDMLNKINGSDIKYLGYLGCSPNKTVLENYLQRILAGELNVTSKQTRLAFGYLSGDRPEHLENAINFFVKNYKRIYQYFEKVTQEEKSSTNATVCVAAILNDYISRTRAADQLVRIKEMSEELESESSSLPSMINDSIAKQTKKIYWSDENDPILGKWFHDNS